MDALTARLVVLAALAAAAAGGALDALEAVLPAPLLEGAQDLVKAASTACDVLPLEMVFAPTNPALPPLQLVVLSRGARRVLRAARAHLALDARLRRPDALLTLYIPGWWNTPDDEAARALAAALLRDQPELLVLDTRPAFCRGYLAAAARVDAVAAEVLQLVRNLARHGVAPARVHLIGFSLGAHVAGRAGRRAAHALGAPLGRITALDPARPCFGRAGAPRLRRGDASFVQVVHASAGVLGVARPAGHADVYLNGVGARQPECRHRRLGFECDHNQAWRRYARSVADARALRGRHCRSWAELAAGACSGAPADLGYAIANHTRGMFLYKSPDQNELELN